METITIKSILNRSLTVVTTLSVLVAVSVSGAILAQPASANAAAKKGWTSLGDIKAGQRGISKSVVTFHVKACKIATSKSGMYKVKFNVKKIAAEDDNYGVWVEAINYSKATVLGDLNIPNPAKFTSKSFTPSKKVSSKDKVYTLGGSMDGTIGTASKAVTTSKLRTCK